MSAPASPLRRAARGCLPASLRPSGRRGYSLTEVMIASAILAFVVVGAIASFIYIRRTTVANNLRTVAMFTAQQTIESLRAIGASDLREQLEWNGVETNDLDNVWEMDAIEKGLTQPRLMLRGVYTRGSDGELVQDLERSHWMDQSVTIYCEGTEVLKEEDIVRVYVDLRWSVSGVEYTDALFTIID